MREGERQRRVEEREKINVITKGTKKRHERTEKQKMSYGGKRLQNTD